MKKLKEIKLKKNKVNSNCTCLNNNQSENYSNSQITTRRNFSKFIDLSPKINCIKIENSKKFKEEENIQLISNFIKNFNNFDMKFVDEINKIINNNIQFCNEELLEKFTKKIKEISSIFLNKFDKNLENLLNLQEEKEREKFAFKNKIELMEEENKSLSDLLKKNSEENELEKDYEKENFNLKNIINEYSATIFKLKQKEANLINLLVTVKNNGINLEKMFEQSFQNQSKNDYFIQKKYLNNNFFDNFLENKEKKTKKNFNCKSKTFNYDDFNNSSLHLFADNSGNFFYFNYIYKKFMFL